MALRDIALLVGNTFLGFRDPKSSKQDIVIPREELEQWEVVYDYLKDSHSPSESLELSSFLSLERHSHNFPEKIATG